MYIHAAEQIAQNVAIGVATTAAAIGAAVIAATIVATAGLALVGFGSGGVIAGKHQDETQMAVAC